MLGSDFKVRLMVSVARVTTGHISFAYVNIQQRCEPRSAALLRSTLNHPNDHKAELSWDLVTLNPPVILGSAFQDVSKPSDLPSSLNLWYHFVFAKVPESVLTSSHCFVHVKDVAKAHVLALEVEAASNQRIIVSSEPKTWQDNLDVVNNLRPSFVQEGITSVGYPDAKGCVSIIYNAEKSKRIFGLEYLSLEEMIKDTVEYFEERKLLVAQKN